MKAYTHESDDNMGNLVVRKRGHSNKNQVMGILGIYTCMKGGIGFPKPFSLARACFAEKIGRGSDQ
jgi:hypothetical protein